MGSPYQTFSYNTHAHSMALNRSLLQLYTHTHTHQLLHKFNTSANYFLLNYGCLYGRDTHAIII